MFWWQLNLADRSLMPGDVVRRFVSDKDNQRGYCRDIKIYCVVQIMGTNKVVRGACSTNLRPVEEFVTDVLVCMDQWMGMLKGVRSHITVRFADGSVCVLEDKEAEKLDDVLDTRDDDSEFRRFDFYPGQVLSGPLKVFAGGEFTHKTPEMDRMLQHDKKGRQLRAVVLKCAAYHLTVNWHSQTNMQDDRPYVDHPGYVMTDPTKFEKVKPLNVFESCTVQIGDRNFYRIQESDVLMSKEEWKRVERQQLQLPPRNRARKKRISARERPGKRKKKVSEEEDVEDSSGSYEDVADAESSSDSDDDSEDRADKRSKDGAKRPSMPAGRGGKKKLKKGRRGHMSGASASGGAKVAESKDGTELKPGDEVAVEILRTSTVADVMWQDGRLERGIPSTDLFPIHHLDDQEFFCGDFVVKTEKAESDPYLYGVVQKVNHLGRTCKVKWFRTYGKSNEEQMPTELGETEEPVYELRDHPVFKYRPGSIVIRVANFAEEGDAAHVSDCCGGQVMDNYPSGQVLARWADGKESFAWPQDLYKIGEYDSDDQIWDVDGEDDEADWSDEDDDADGEGASSWETESEHSVEAEEAAGAVGDLPDSAVVLPKLLDAVDRSREAMSRLEEKLEHNPDALQGGAYLRQLLEVYKGCKCVISIILDEIFLNKC